MAKQTFLEDKHNWMIQVLNFRLPSPCKKYGITAAALIVVFLIGYKIWGANSLVVKEFFRGLLLLCLLIASVSKDVLEDEYNRHIRHQSFVIAFVAATAYAVVIPLIAMFLDTLIHRITGDGMINFYETSSFEVVFILLGFQLLFFETLKRFYRAE